MSRVKNFSKAVFSGYALLGVNILYTLASVPLALHYLSKEEFGLWVLVTQVCNFNSLLIDLGMAGAMSRILIDHKDDKTNPAYGSVIQTGFLVLLVQGVLIAVVGGLISYWLPHWMAVPENHWSIFRSLVIWQCIMLAISFSTRIFVFILQAHQRYDIGNYSNIGGFVLSLGALWAGFYFNMGLYSLLLAGGASILVTGVYSFWKVWQLNLFPQKGCWGRPNRATFKELFFYGLDIFLLSIGQQLISASQVPVITKTLGLEAAAVWSIAIKFFVMVQQLVYRLFDFSAAAFSEMMVREERERLQMRFRDIVVLTGSVSVSVGLMMALCNQSFLHLWTRNRISWSIENDLLMSISLIVYAITRCHIGLAGLTKQILTMKYVYLTEGVAFAGLGLLLAPKFGLMGVILSGIVTNLIFSGIYGNYRTAKYFQIRKSELIVVWLRPSAWLLLILSLAAIVVWNITHSLTPFWQLLAGASMMGVVTSYCFWKVGLPSGIRKELLARYQNWRARASSG